MVPITSGERSDYALVTLSREGNRTVGFTTTANTRDQKYTINVERPDPYDPPASDDGPNRTFMSGDADITIEKGGTGIGVQAPVPASIPVYFLGEEITFSGTNSLSDTTYLFITGPNLPEKGGQMTNPRAAVTPVIPDSFGRADVLPDGSWEYKWQTAFLDIDPGTYTVYAVNSTADKGMLDQSSYSTVSFNIRKPFIGAQVSQSSVAAGDKLFIRGIAAGQPLDGIAVWIFGTNKVLYQTTNVNPDGTFEQEISSAQTEDLAAGQYFVVVQHPMTNERFDVFPDNPGSPASVLGSYPVYGNQLFRVGGPGSLQGSDAATALVQAINNQDIDDIYTKLLFLVELPKIAIIPVTDHQEGDTFTFSGTTNLAAGDDILVQVVSSSFQPTAKTSSGEFSGAAGSVKVLEGTGNVNTWSFTVDTATFRPDSYIVEVSSVIPAIQASTLFNVTGAGLVPIRTIKPGQDVSEANGTATGNAPSGYPGTNLTAGSTTQEGEIAGSTVNTTPGNSTNSDEGVAKRSRIDIGARPSKLFNTSGPGSPTVPTTVRAPVQVVTTAATIPDVRTTAPTARPTAQPGFGAATALAALGAVIFIAVRNNRRAP